MGIDLSMQSHVDEYKQALERATERAMEAVGQQCVTHAKQNLKGPPKREDTGLLRNSITHALGGKSPAISSYKADRGDGEGSYSGTAPSDSKGQRSVYVGTNVEYAFYVHDGTSRMTPNRFIKNAVMEHKDEYKAIAENELKKG